MGIIVKQQWLISLYQ